MNLLSEHNGDKLFITSILKQAFSDILNAPSAHTDPSIKYRAGSKHSYSADAKRFVNKRNYDFIYYCGLLDLDAEYAEKKFYEQINKIVNSPDLLKVMKNAL